MHARDLELVKTMKMPSDDQVNSVISQTCFCVHGNTFVLSQKRTLKCSSGNVCMESWPSMGNHRIQQQEHNNNNKVHKKGKSLVDGNIFEHSVICGTSNTGHVCGLCFQNLIFWTFLQYLL